MARLKIYEFDQTNSGGHFHEDDKLCHKIYIEANSSEHACDIAESIGIYFDGCDLGIDCSCCGDRWSRPYESDALTFPYAYATYSESEAQTLVDRYGCTTKKLRKPKWGRDIEITFPDISSFTQYVADHNGWFTNPDARIFYLNGRVEDYHRKEYN